MERSRSYLTEKLKIVNLSEYLTVCVKSEIIMSNIDSCRTILITNR